MSIPAMDSFDTKALFTCPHCKYHHRVFRITCPNCGRILIRDISEKPASTRDSRKTDIYTGRFLLKAIAILTLIWIAILLFFYYF